MEFTSLVWKIINWRFYETLLNLRCKAIWLYTIFIYQIGKNINVENQLKDVEKSNFSVENYVENVKNHVNKRLKNPNITIIIKKIK